MQNFQQNIQFPLFTNVGDANPYSDFDFNMLSDYVFDEDDYFPHKDGFTNKSDSTVDVSDNEELSSSDENDSNKKRKVLDDKPKTQDQVDRRRERNRVLARKTRLRKKFFFESLQRQVSQLKVENSALKQIIQQRISSAQTNESNNNSNYPGTTTLISLNDSTKATSILEKSDFQLMKAIQAAQRSFVITDPSLPDNPIIFASKGFLDMCGYRLEEVLGRNCRFLQGPDSDAVQVDIMRQGILKGEDTSVCLLNYKADGTRFYNQVFVAALRDETNTIINYVGVQVEVTTNLLKEDITDSNSSTTKSSTRNNLKSSNRMNKNIHNNSNTGGINSLSNTVVGLKSSKNKQNKETKQYSNPYGSTSSSAGSISSSSMTATGLK